MDGDDALVGRIGGWERVFVVRHGETEWNRAGRMQGRLDSPLTDLGHAQARGYAQTLVSHDVDLIATSPLGRTRQTAEHLRALLAVDVVLIDGLAELDHGEAAGLTRAQFERRRAGQFAERDRDKYRWRFPGGESYEDLEARVTNALRRLARYPVRRPVIVTHEMLGRILRRHLLGLDPAVALDLGHPHGVVYEIDPAAHAEACLAAQTRT